MALLRVESKGKPHTIKAQLDGNTAAELKLYARFAGDATLDAVIKAALAHVFDQDKDFHEWKKNPDNLKDPERPQRRKAEVKQPIPTTAAHHETPKTGVK
jgi:hypothetical protein